MSLICVTLAAADSQRLLAQHRELVAQGCRLVEYRLDFLLESQSAAADVVRLIENRPGPVIVTLRRPEDGGKWTRTEDERRALLRAVMAAGADYVDLEPDAALAIQRSGPTRRIVSMHDFQETPDDLTAVHARLAACDADVVKLAVMARRPSDNFRVLRVVAGAKIPTAGFCMGELGAASRILAAKFGAPFSYAAPSDEAAVAPGQIGFSRMRDLYRYEAITSATPFYCVIGDPIGHSQSPLIHNAALAALGLDGCYVPFRIPPDGLDAFLAEAREFGIRGVSVTIPHKEAVLRRITHLDPAAAAIGAANTLVFADAGETYGYNTDEPGALESLEAALAAPLAGKCALVLGAGGVAKGIAYGLLRRGARTIVTNRNRARAEELAAAPGCEVVDWDRRSEVPYDILVNCTPLGMFPKMDDTPLDAAALRPGSLVFDTVYNPTETRLLREARKRGCSTVVGTEMFLRQAAWQFRYFTGCEAPLEVMRAALRSGAVLGDEAVVLIGYRGTGKSTVARHVAERLGWEFIDADVELEHRAGKSIAQIFAADGELAFRDLEAQVLADVLRRQRVVLAAGGGAVLREANRSLLKSCGRVAWLEARPETLLARIQADATTNARRPNLTSQGGLPEIVELLVRREPWYRECASLRLDADRSAPAAVAESLLAAWFPSAKRKPS